MSSKRIKGITVEIGGDTTKLDKALSGTNKTLSQTQSALKDVERLLKLDPGNTELLEQKQRLLAQAAQASAEKLDTLRQAAQNADAALQRGKEYSAKYEPLKGQLDKITASLRGLEANAESMEQRLSAGQISAGQYEAYQKKLEETRREQEALKQSIQDLNRAFSGARMDQSQYDALQRELAATAREAKDLKKAAEQSAGGLDELGRAARDTADKAGAVSKTFAPVTSAIRKVGVAAAGTVVLTEDLRAGLSRLDESARSSGAGLEDARGAFEQFYQVAGQTDSAIEATANLLQSGLTENRLQMAVEALSGAVIRFPDTLNIESLADSLQETLATGTATGQFAELLDRMGVGAEAFSEQLALCTDQVGRQELVLGALARGGLMESYESWMQNNQALADNRQATLDLQLEMAELAETLQPLMTTILELAQGLMDWFNGLDSGTQKAVVGVALLAGAVSPLAGAVASVSKVLPAFISLLGQVDGRTAAVAIALTAIVGMAAMVAGAWDDMSGLEKAASVLGLLGAAALTAAVAVGAFQSASSMGMAAVGIAAGIAAVAAAVASANQRAQADAGSLRAPGLANGGLVPPGDPFLAVLGDNKREVEVVSPYSTLKQAAAEAVRENLPAQSGGTGAAADLYLDGTRLGRALWPYLRQEEQRRGVQLIGGVRTW